MSDDLVSRRRDGHVLVITMRREAKRNAVDRVPKALRAMRANFVASERLSFGVAAFIKGRST